MPTDLPFEFVEGGLSEASSDVFVVRLPRGLSTKAELLTALSESLRLPGYFGFNWDALFDCLLDMHWVDARQVVLAHADVPRLPQAELRAYLEVLVDAIGSWKPDEERVLRVSFPACARAELSLRSRPRSEERDERS
ncbi:MAG: barstar family protein [Nannocystaceae bacterium]